MPNYSEEQLKSLIPFVIMTYFRDLPKEFKKISFLKNIYLLMNKKQRIKFFFTSTFTKAFMKYEALKTFICSECGASHYMEIERKKKQCEKCHLITCEVCFRRLYKCDIDTERPYLCIDHSRREKRIRDYNRNSNNKRNRS